MYQASVERASNSGMSFSDLKLIGNYAAKGWIVCRFGESAWLGPINQKGKIGIIVGIGCTICEATYDALIFTDYFNFDLGGHLLSHV